MPFNGRKFIREMMCRPARFTAYMTREHGKEEGERVWKQWTIEERDGWIVGATWLQTGKRHPGYGGGYNILGELDDYEPPTFEETAPRRLVYLVTPWPTAKPRFVPPECVTLIEDGEPFHPSKWDSAAREYSSQWARERAERDEKGRWL